MASSSWLQSLHGHPRGVYLVAFVEVWERTSFYGMLALLALFLVSPQANHGFGWSNGDSVRLVGIYISLIYGASILGGWLADRFFGPRRALVFGGISMCIGHFLMAGPAVIPALFEQVTSVPATAILESAGYPLARLGSVPEAAEAIRAYVSATLPAAEPAEHYVAVSVRAYVSAGGSFYTALFFLVLGTGLFKPNSYVVIGSLYRDADARRESGFTLHYMGINVGALLGPLVVGTIGEFVGWHYGFTVAGFGMAAGLAIFLKYQRGLIGELPGRWSKKRNSEMPPERAFTRLEHERLVIIAMLSVFATVFWTAFYQMAGLLNLYALQSVDRSLFGMEVPATWLSGLNPFYIIVLGPLFVSLWRSLQRRGQDPRLCTKFAMGLGLVGLCFLTMYFATFEQQASPILKASMAWLVLAYLLMTLGELCLSPVGNAAVTRLAPRPVVGIMMGVWFLSSAVAGWLSGEIGASADEHEVRQVFLFLALVTGGFSALPLVLSRWITPRSRQPVPDAAT